MSDVEERMLSGELYDPGDSDLMAEQFKHLEQVRLYNNTPCTLQGLMERDRMLKEMFADIGERCYIEPPFHSNWGGAHVHFGDNVYANYNLMLVDDTHIYVGDRTMFGPNVVVATAAHPVLTELRARGIEYNLPVHIGADCWIGASAVIMPGVTIGDGSVIGAGSVVTHDIPEQVVAVGVPCKVLREIGEQDREFYHEGMAIDPSWLEDTEDGAKPAQ